MGGRGFKWKTPATIRAKFNSLEKKIVAPIPTLKKAYYPLFTRVEELFG